MVEGERFLKYAIHEIGRGEMPVSLNNLNEALRLERFVRIRYALGHSVRK